MRGGQRLAQPFLDMARIPEEATLVAEPSLGRLLWELPMPPGNLGITGRAQNRRPLHARRPIARQSYLRRTRICCTGRTPSRDLPSNDECIETETGIAAEIQASNTAFTDIRRGVT
jgi:hypothetical protein